MIGAMIGGMSYLICTRNKVYPRLCKTAQADARARVDCALRIAYD